MTAGQLNGFYRGVIKSMSGTTARITVTRVGGANIYLARVVIPAGAPTAAFGATSVTVGGNALALRPYQAGDEVLVGFLEGRHDAPVVLGRLA